MSSQVFVEATGQVIHVAGCYQSLARILGKQGRQAEQIQVLERGIGRLERGLESSNQAMKDFVEDNISKLKADFIQAYMYAGRRQDALSLIDVELKKKPIKWLNAPRLVENLRLLGMGQAALEVARLAEYTAQVDAASSDLLSRKLARSGVDR
jgi:hypothetical protein